MEAEERVLRRVLGLVHPPEQAEGGAQDHPLVPFDQDGEGLRVAGARPADPLGRLHDSRAVGQVGGCQAQVSRRSLRASRRRYAPPRGTVDRRHAGPRDGTLGGRPPERRGRVRLVHDAGQPGGDVTLDGRQGRAPLRGPPRDRRPPAGPSASAFARPSIAPSARPARSPARRTPSRGSRAAAVVRPGEGRHHRDPVDSGGGLGARGQLGERGHHVPHAQTCPRPPAGMRPGPRTIMGTRMPPS